MQLDAAGKHNKPHKIELNELYEIPFMLSPSSKLSFVSSGLVGWPPVKRKDMSDTLCLTVASLHGCC